MIIFNNFTRTKITELNKELKLRLSYHYDDYITSSLYSHQLDDWRDWFKQSLKDYPNSAVVFNIEKNDKSTMYKNEWKLIPMLANRYSDVIITGKDEYVYFRKGQVLKSKYNQNGLVRIILEIHTGVKQKYSVTELALLNYLKDTYEYPEKQAIQTIESFKDTIQNNATFKNRLDIVFTGFNVNDDAIKDSIYRYSDQERYLFKLLWLLFFIKNPDPIYLNKVNINSQDESEQVNLLESTENLINAIERIAKIKINIDDLIISTEPDYETMSEEYLDYYKSSV